MANTNGQHMQLRAAEGVLRPVDCFSSKGACCNAPAIEHVQCSNACCQPVVCRTWMAPTPTPTAACQNHVSLRCKAAVHPVVGHQHMLHLYARAPQTCKAAEDRLAAAQAALAEARGNKKAVVASVQVREGLTWNWLHQSAVFYALGPDGHVLTFAHQRKLMLDP